MEAGKSLEERAVLWKFAVLDSNSNQVNNHDKRLTALQASAGSTASSRLVCRSPSDNFSVTQLVAKIIQLAQLLCNATILHRDIRTCVLLLSSFTSSVITLYKRKYVIESQNCFECYFMSPTVAIALLPELCGLIKTTITF